jgi:hypothetical protein
MAHNRGRNYENYVSYVTLQFCVLVSYDSCIHLLSKLYKALKIKCTFESYIYIYIYIYIFVKISHRFYHFTSLRIFWWPQHTTYFANCFHPQEYLSSSSCSWRFKVYFLFLNRQEVGLSISFMVILCSFNPSVYIVVLVLIIYLCPSSVRVVATFLGIVYFLYYVMCARLFPNTLILFFI